MNAPRRFVQGGTSPLGRSLLEAALQEEPSNRAVTRALAAVATGAAVAGAASSASAATAAVSGATAAATSSGAAAPAATIAACAQGAGASAAGNVVWSGLAGSAVAKWLGAGVAAVALSAAAVKGVEQLQGQQSSVVAAPPAAALPAEPLRSAREEALPPSVAPPPGSASAASVSVPAAAARRLPAAVSKSAGTAATAAPSPPRNDAPDIQAEIELLDRVRERIATGNTDSALGTLQEYERRFPSGQLGPEMLAMRMDAQLRAGNRDGALASARQLIATSPHSPQAARARTLVSSSVINPSPPKD